MGKKYSNAEKLAIVKEASDNGVKITLEKCLFYPATFYYLNPRIMKALVSDSIKIYNHKRPHNSCYMVTPEMMNEVRQI
jgi:hypothetical protein